MNKPPTMMTSGMKSGVRHDNESKARSDEAMHEVLAFKLASETYALPLAGVQEILKPPRITKLPRAAHEILGIVSVRGRVTTVIDLRRRLRVREAAFDKNTRVLLIDAGKEVLGLLGGRRTAGVPPVRRRGRAGLGGGWRPERIRDGHRPPARGAHPGPRLRSRSAKTPTTS